RPRRDDERREHHRHEPPKNTVASQQVSLVQIASCRLQVADSLSTKPGMTPLARADCPTFRSSRGRREEFPVTFLTLAATYEYERRSVDRDVRRSALPEILRRRPRGFWADCRALPISNLLSCLQRVRQLGGLRGSRPRNVHRRVAEVG